MTADIYFNEKGYKLPFVGIPRCYPAKNII